MSNKEYDYDESSEILNKQILDSDPAEIQGLISGMLCVLKGEQGRQKVLALITDELNCTSVDTDVYEEISRIVQYTGKQLEESHFDLELLLMDDDEAIGKKVRCLSNWCRGFLCGIGLAGLDTKDTQNTMLKEIIQDLSHIAYRQFAEDNDIDDEANEVNERAYFELLEYVRMAVQTVYLELRVMQTLH